MVADDSISRARKSMNTDYLLLCGAMWAQHASMDACEELVRALDCDDPDVVLLASVLLRNQKVAFA
jgi:hypothetical protein